MQNSGYVRKMVNMNILQRNLFWLCLLVLAAGVVCATQAAAAQPYPTRPIRLIVPFAPGGGPDILARLLAPRLAETFKQSVVVDNRPGGGGTMGIETAVRANPDGHTMIIVSSGYAANAALHKLPYDAVNDVAPIVLMGETGFVVALHPSVPAASIKELIAYDKTNPGKLNYGSSGTGSASHLAAALFSQMAGIPMTHVPYKGGGLAMNDLIGGQIQFIVNAMPLVMPSVRSNRLRAIAVTTTRRTAVAPDIPTVAESVAGYEAVNWYAVLGPKALPRDVIARWNEEVNRMVQSLELKDRMASDGMELVGGLPDRVYDVLRRDVAKWQNVVRIGGIKPGN